MIRSEKESMTERERLAALLNRQPVDRVALDTHSSSFAAATAGYTKVDIYQNPEKAFWAKRWTQEMFGAYEFIFYHGGAPGVREFGGTVEMPTSEFAMSVSPLQPAVQSEEDVEKLELPDVKKAGAIPLIMQFSKLQAEHCLPISFNCGGVLDIAASIAGVDRVCRWMIKKPELVHKLCKMAVRFFIAQAEYWVETFGPENLMPTAGAPTESNQIVSPKQFEEFCLPYQKEVNERLLDLGVKHIFFHICGEQDLNLPYWAQVPMGDPGIVTFGHEVDIDTASRYFPNDIIMGNVNPALIQSGTAQEVYELCKACIEKGKKHRAGFILAPGCEMPAKAPPYNVWMMRKAIEDFGWY